MKQIEKHWVGADIANTAWQLGAATVKIIRVARRIMIIRRIIWPGIIPEHNAVSDDGQVGAGTLVEEGPKGIVYDRAVVQGCGQRPTSRRWAATADITR